MSDLFTGSFLVSLLHAVKIEKQIQRGNSMINRFINLKFDVLNIIKNNLKDSLKFLEIISVVCRLISWLEPLQSQKIHLQIEWHLQHYYQGNFR